MGLFPAARHRLGCAKRLRRDCRGFQQRRKHGHCCHHGHGRQAIGVLPTTVRIFAGVARGSGLSNARPCWMLPTSIAMAGRTSWWRPHSRLCGMKTRTGTSGVWRQVIDGLADAAWLRACPHNVVIWDTASRQPVLSFPADSIAVDRAAFSADDKLLATAGREGVIRFWDIRTGSCVRVLPRLAAPERILDLAFSSDGKHLLFAAGDQGYVWDLTRQSVAAQTNRP